MIQPKQLEKSKTLFLPFLAKLFDKAAFETWVVASQPFYFSGFNHMAGERQMTFTDQAIVSKRAGNLHSIALTNCKEDTVTPPESASEMRRDRKGKQLWAGLIASAFTHPYALFCILLVLANFWRVGLTVLGLIGMIGLITGFLILRKTRWDI